MVKETREDRVPYDRVAYLAGLVAAGRSVEELRERIKVVEAELTLLQRELPLLWVALANSMGETPLPYWETVALQRA